MMNYYFSKTVKGQFDEVVERVVGALEEQGFGVLTEIDVQQILKKKLDVDFHKYRILGACNPPFAYEALQTEDKIGTMLPCNVIVQETAQGVIEVAAVDPVSSMLAVANEKLRPVAVQIQGKLKQIVENL